MSIPGGLFPGHRRQPGDVDGGLVNNLPTEVMREMEPIVCVIGRERLEAKDVQSLFGCCSSRCAW